MKKLLALNRGEIAIRIMRAATELGLRTVAVFAREDALSLHRFKADEAYQIGEGQGPVAAYLDVEGIVALAAEKQVDAIHPGYGFLSENPALPRACRAAGITFVGPDADLLELLGDKTAARGLAGRAGVPIVPGVAHALNDSAAAVEAARTIGFPLIVKAAFGGGGRGMRVVESAEDLPQKFDEARREAAAAFGNGAVFIERYIRAPRHIEVQVLGDRHGNVVHLYERDCSVQRRHQKVVEVAPAVGLDPRVRDAICDAAVRLMKMAGYNNAGTVEFLVDTETNDWFFIEVNPRIQVEHTVTEMVTGVDLVRSQILIAQGKSLSDPAIALGPDVRIPLNGYALQCRVTTEDPSTGFVPDYGKIHTYRSPAGLGIRLDGGSAYGGAVITPYYDSLLVKLTAWDREFPLACQRMDRALREFRIRGVKTNIPFLENVVNNAVFRSGKVTTRFIDDTPELFRFTPRQDRATKVLTYIADVIVNGNPEVAGKPVPQKLRPAPVPAHRPGSPPRGTRQVLDELGPEKFAKWTTSQTRLLLTDTTLRDAHQSLMATRVRTFDMAAIANFIAHELSGLYSLEMWGGATFDVSMRFLLEDPWKRLRRLRELVPNICFQMLFRASNAVGYTAYPDNAVRAFVAEAAAQGMDIFRVFDSLNWLPNMKVAMEAVVASGKVCEAAVCYTGDILDPARDKYPLTYYVRIAKELERMGAHVLGIKDMAGLCRPYAAEKLVRTLRQEIGIPIHFHTHDTSGVNAASILKASEAGLDVADVAVAAMSGTTSQPNMNSVVAALDHTPRATGIDLAALNTYSDYWETVRTYYAPFDNAPPSGTAEVYVHEMPGGQYTNLREQADAMGLADRWQQIARTYADVNKAFGDIVKVTPSSKVVGDMAIFLVTHGLTMRDFEALGPAHTLTLPNSVVEMFGGSLGQPEGGWPPALQAMVLKNQKPIEGRPGESLPPIDLEATAALLQRQIGRQPFHDETLSYVMYPDVFTKFARAEQRFGDLAVVPTRQFFYGMTTGDEISIDLEPGKRIVVKFLTVGEAHADGRRTVFFELNGQPREVTVVDRSLKTTARAKEMASPQMPGHIGAPTPGVVTAVAVEAGQRVEAGQKLLVLEAMKMQSTVYAPLAGTITRRLVEPGQTVDTKELLLVIDG